MRAASGILFSICVVALLSGFASSLPSNSSTTVDVARANNASVLPSKTLDVASGDAEAPNASTTIPPTNTTSAPPTTSATTSTSATPTSAATSTTAKPIPTNTTTTTATTPTTTTEKPTTTSTKAPPAAGGRRFDAPSFFGGIILAVGLLAICYVAFKFYRSRTEHNYHSLQETVHM